MVGSAKFGPVIAVAPVGVLFARRADGAVIDFPATTAVLAGREANPAKIRGFDAAVVELPLRPPG